MTGVVPAGFEAYARVLHPVEQEDQPSTSWAAVAEAAGTQIHALAQWHLLAPRRGSTRPWWRTSGPDIGNLDPEALADLVTVLRRHTTTAAECWFCLWSGYGWIHGSPSAVLLQFDESAGLSESEPVPPAFPDDVLAADQLVRLAAREYLLGRGPLEAATRVGDQITPDWFEPQSPNIFWPTDRSWCVATEIDFDSTLVGGSEQLVTELVTHERLEAFRIQPQDSLQDNADHVN
ncbi:hypothetical protein ACFFOM_20610 [Microlunatus capsulatus]|uniref:DUF317 domain-containing protein n=1 Tax=Microlunatus capsulatus TaxID=99117 RepID=A0ABS4ZCY7_9ACTN|nr:hypothetical protein [Microlunatus capsulatus]